MGWTTKESVLVLSGASDFSLLSSTQLVSGAHPPSYWMGSGGFYLGAKV